MSIAAEMFVRTPDPLTDEQMAALFVRLASAGTRAFWLEGPEEIPRDRMVRTASPITDDAASDDGLWWRIPVWGSLHYTNYQRGDLWAFVAVAEWLERNVLGSQVFYGGDAWSHPLPFGKPEREALIQEWAAQA